MDTEYFSILFITWLNTHGASSQPETKYYQSQQEKKRGVSSHETMRVPTLGKPLAD